MIGSLRLLLEDFLGLMREEGELDVFLPLLMSAMGHEVVYRAQKGTRQYGVDIVSIGDDVDGIRTLFLWLVKCGDIGRTDWDSGPQSIRQSINDVSDVYLRSHVSPAHQKLKKKLLIVTNGDFNASLNETIAAFLERWCSEQKADAEQINGSKLATWTESHLLDEYILPLDSRILLRRMLANVASPDLCINVGRDLINQIVDGAISPTKSKPAATKKQLTGLRGMRTALQVLFIWSVNEDNLLAAYSLHQYAVLATWSRLHNKLHENDKNLRQELCHLLDSLLMVAETYHQKMDPYYGMQDAFVNVRPHSLLVSMTVFDELGKLGLIGCLFAFQPDSSSHPSTNDGVRHYVRRIKKLLNSHACCDLPAFDHHSVNIHIALLLLVVSGEREIAKNWLSRLCIRMQYATRWRKFMPMSGTFEDALAVRDGEEEMPEEFCNTSTLLPIMFIWVAALEMREAYDALRLNVVPNFKGITPNFWSSESGYDDVVGDERALFEHGIGESVKQFPEDPHEFLQTMSTGLLGIEGIETTTWYQLRAQFIPLLAGLYWQLQLPREMLVKQTIAVASSELTGKLWPVDTLNED
ncbi:hypothetical protein [Deefgea piscis]|uniref:hypothetical protein n=1 Tax=Deefgea piscis TaxID=2739061 RepID=UPI001C825EC4|nr:hypothetical protein [Deefgea piscis]QZA82254.1 hypothetical protein K4H25_06325 [Deefgea piscis]